MRLEPWPLLARSTASSAAPLTSSASVPSTRTPGIPYVSARRVTSPPADKRLEANECAYWLSSHTNKTGSRQIAGEIQAFVEDALADRAVSEEGDGHAVGALELEPKRSPCRKEDACPHHPVLTDHSNLDVGEVHRAASSLAVPGRAAP